MRLPLVAELDSRDGTSDKDGRMSNVLLESDEQGDFAVVRPGIKFETKIQRETTYQGKGLVSFNDDLISVYGSKLCTPKENWTADSRYLDADTGMLYMHDLGMNGSTIFVTPEYFDMTLGEKFFSYSSDNGATWTASAPATIINNYGQISRATVLPNGGYLIRHTGNFTKEYWTSPDGITWTTRTNTGGYNWFGRASGANNGTRLVIGDGSSAYYSDDNGESFTVVGGAFQSHYVQNAQSLRANLTILLVTFLLDRMTQYHDTSAVIFFLDIPLQRILLPELFRLKY